jgi:hypothetical protein
VHRSNNSEIIMPLLLFYFIFWNVDARFKSATSDNPHRIIDLPGFDSPG